MLSELYFKNMKEVLEKIEKTQMDNIKKSAEAIANSITNGGIWHIHDTGHMLMHEAIGRTGGMMAIRPVIVNVEVNNPTRKRANIGKTNVYLDSIAGLPEFIIGKSNMEPGDILMIGSVSGKNILPVELAIKAREKGLTTIAITSVEYSSALESAHPSGKRLFEVCDIVIDNCSNVSDTLVHVDELNMGICPSSGISAAYIMWALQSEIVEIMLKAGKTPHVYINNHMSGASQLNNKAWSEYERLGY